MKIKVACPGNHKNHSKILMAYDSERPRFWVFCSGLRSKCNRWVQVDINEKGGVTTTLMPKDYHFDFEKKPSLVCGV